MIFDHRVKHNGILYEAGQNVPIEEKAIAPESKKEDAAEKVASSSHLFPADEDAQEEKPKRRGGRPKKE